MAGLIKHCATTSKLTAAYLSISLMVYLIVFNMTHLIIYIKDNLLTIAVSLAGAIALGILMDGDHISPKRICQLFKGDRRPVQGWTNYCHTFWFALIIIIATLGWSFLNGFSVIKLLHLPNTSFLVNLMNGFSIIKLLPLGSYALHIFIDAANKNTINSPLPIYLARFIPEKYKYSHPVGKFL